MQLFLLGATGRTGRQVVDLALARGHHVTAFVRTPRKIRRQHARLRVVEGRPHDQAALTRAMDGHEAVISALGPAPRDAMTRSTLLRECATTTVAAMRSAGVERVAVVSTAMLFDGGGAGVRLIRRLMAPHLQDSRMMEGLFAQSGLRWTVARPPRLVHANDESYRADVGRLPSELTLRSWLSWKGVAAFLLDSLAAESHSRQVVGICH